MILVLQNVKYVAWKSIAVYYYFFLNIDSKTQQLHYQSPRHGQYRNRNDLSPTPNHEFLRKIPKSAAIFLERRKNIFASKMRRKISNPKQSHSYQVNIFYKSPIGIEI